MRNTKKKGFTIIELVVVVAVIAILAAVLIPTFSGIIKKAKLNADEQTVANMNKYVAAADAEKEFVFAADAVNALYANGFNMGKFETFSKGYHYAYDFEDNKFYLLNEEDKAVFPNDDVTVADLWGFFNNAKDDKIAGVTKYIALAPIVDGAVFNEPDCVFSDITGNIAYTLDLNKKTLAVAAKDGQKIKLMNGTVLENLGTYELDTESMNKRVAATVGDITGTAAVDGVLTVEGKAFVNNSGELNLADFGDSITDVIFKDCTFDQIAYEDFNVGRNAANLKSITFEDCTITLPTKDNKDGKAVSIFSNSNGEDPTNVTIKGCYFSGARGVIFGRLGETIDSNYGKIVIENNVFVNTIDSTKALVQFAAGSHEFKATSISIKDNEFTSGSIAIRIHDTVQKMTCSNVVISGNKFANGMTKIDGDGQPRLDTIVNAWISKIQ